MMKSFFHLVFFGCIYSQVFHLIIPVLGEPNDDDDDGVYDVPGPALTSIGDMVDPNVVLLVPLGTDSVETADVSGEGSTSEEVIKLTDQLGVTKSESLALSESQPEVPESSKMATSKENEEDEKETTTKKASRLKEFVRGKLINEIHNKKPSTVALPIVDNLATNESTHHPTPGDRSEAHNRHLYDELVQLDAYKDLLPIQENLHLALAFYQCCEASLTNTTTLLVDFIDHYGLLDKQKDIVHKCKTTFDQTGTSCDMFWSRLEELQKEITETVKKSFGNDAHKEQAALQSVHPPIGKLENWKDTFFKYLAQVSDVCPYLAALVWYPDELNLCESKVETAMAERNLSHENYIKFQNEISQPFRQKVIRMFKITKNAWAPIQLHGYHKPKSLHSAPSTSTPPSAPTPVTTLTQNVVNQNIQDFTDAVLPFETLSKHPMIYHRVASGIAYQACCGHQNVASTQTFDTYLTNINVDADFGTLMQSLFSNCVTHFQTLSVSTNVNHLHNCQNAEIEMKEALKTRENFIISNSVRNVKLVEHFQNALSPKLANSQQLHRMGAFTLSDCRKHIFELLFDIPELVTCHTHLMNLTFSQGQNHYTDYVQNIAEPVLSIITNDFQELEKARVQIVHKPTKSHSPKPQLRQPAPILQNTPSSAGVVLIPSRYFNSILLFSFVVSFFS